MCSEVVPLPTGALHDENGHGMGPRLPGCLEHRRPVRPRQRGLGEPGVTDIVDAHSRATPIIESRVTSAASSSSAISSVSAGRMGSTRYRTSADESHTRISTSSATGHPISASSTLGSRTMRDRYGGLLYQLGGSPSTGHG